MSHQLHLSNLLHHSLLIQDHFGYRNVLFNLAQYFFSKFIDPNLMNYFMECFHQNIKNLPLDNNHFPYAHHFLICFSKLSVLDVGLESAAT
jgi:hypothetical protein